MPTRLVSVTTQREPDVLQASRNATMDAAAVGDDDDARPRHPDHGSEPRCGDRTTSNAKRRRCAAPQLHEFEEAREAMEAIFHRPEKR